MDASCPSNLLTNNQQFISMVYLKVPGTKITHWLNNITAGISPFSIGNTFSTGPFSIPMLVYWSISIWSTIGGSSQDGRKWLGSPPFISHGKAIWKGNNPILGGRKLTMVINHLQVMAWSSKYPPGPSMPLFVTTRMTTYHFLGSGIPNYTINLHLRRASIRGVDPRYPTC